MATRAGVGYSENPKSHEAGVEAASAAMKELGFPEAKIAEWTGLMPEG